MSNFETAKSINHEIIKKLSEIQTLIEDSSTERYHHLFLGIQLVKAFNSGLFEEVDALDDIVRKGVLLNEINPSQFVYIDESLQQAKDEIEESLEDDEIDHNSILPLDEEDEDEDEDIYDEMAKIYEDEDEF